MTMPPGKRASLEMIEAQFVLELEILLLDRPAMMGEPDQGPQRRGDWQTDEVGLHARRRAEIAFEQDPDLRGSTMRPAWRRGPADRRKVRFPGSVVAVAPAHDAPGAAGQLLGNRPDRFGAR